MPTTLRKRRQAVEIGQTVAQQEWQAQRANERAVTVRALRTLLAGALAAIVILLLLRLGPADFWGPFARGGGRIFRDLLCSGVVGGVAAQLAARPHPRALPAGAVAPGVVPAAAAPALGWGLLGLAQHIWAAGSFVDNMSLTLRQGPNFGRLAMNAFVNNITMQPLCVAAGLGAAALAGFLVEKRFGTARAGEASAAESSGVVAGEATPEGPPTPGSVLLATLLIAALAFVLTWVLGFVLLRVVPDPALGDLPVPLARAVPRALVAALAFGVAGYTVAPRFRGAASAACILAPCVFAVCLAGLMQSGSSPALLFPAASLYWNSSPFEAATWSSFGALTGLWLAAL